MGTRICILRVGGVIAQYGPPDEILSNPVDEFVADFVGADRGLKRLNLVRAEAVMSTDIVRVYGPDKTDDAVAELQAAGRRTAWVVDEAERLLGYVMLDEARGKPGVRVDLLMREMPAVTEPEATLKDAFSEMLTNNLITLPVLDEESRLLGIVRVETIQELIRSVEQES